MPATDLLMGFDAISTPHPQFLEILGAHSTPEVNLAMHVRDSHDRSVGARYDDRVTRRLLGFSPGRRKVYSGIDWIFYNKTVPSRPAHPR